VQPLAIVFLAFVATITAIYGAAAFALVAGSWMLPRGGRRHLNAADLPFVTVVVAARNESSNVAACLDSLLAVDYPTDRFEVLFIDDHSEDDTRSRAEAIAAQCGNVRVLALADLTDDRLRGKQNALDFGIRSSQGSIIASTDADCVVPPTWLSNIVSHFLDDTGVVIGFSMLDRPRVRDRALVKLQSLELLALFATFAASLRWNIALACTGNNLAYRRSVYEELGGFSKMGFTVAEDNMFVQWVNRHTTWRIEVATEAAATVWTAPMPTFRAFLRQRLRWASNSLENRFSAVWFMVVAYGVNWLMPTAVVLGLLGWVSLPWALAIASVKALPELCHLWRTLSLFGRRDLLPYVPLVGPFHTLYVLIVGIAGLSGRVVWKDREHDTQRKR